MDATDFLLAVFLLGLFLDVIVPAIVNDKDLIKLFWIFKGFKWIIVWFIKQLFKNNFDKTEKATGT